METVPSLRLVAASKACLKGFNSLLSSLETAEGPRHRSLMPPQILRNQRDRFKIWASSLGALQTGRASLDFRLRDSTLMQATVYKLLTQLEDTMKKSSDIVCGARKPLEETLTLGHNEDSLWGESAEDDSSSDDQDCPTNTRTELGQSTLSIIQILSDLFKLAFRIRNPMTRSRGQAILKPLLFKKLVHVDGTTAVDAMACYAEFDRRYVEETFRELQRSVHGRQKLDAATTDTHHESSESREIKSSQHQGIKPEGSAQGYLIDRWSKSLTNRRRYFAYWQNHAQKLGREDDDNTQHEHRAAPYPGPLEPPAASTFAAKTTFSGTEVSTYNENLDDGTETLSVASYTSTSTAYGSDGAAVELPRAPTTRPEQTEFQCPYCWVVCPARHAIGKSWRQHILRDIQPYMCTYEDCPDPDTLYPSRSAWLAHEADVHRSVWRCAAHPRQPFASNIALQKHFELEHGDRGLTQSQAHEIAQLSHASTADSRTLCPFCRTPGPFARGLSNHMAFHMEQLACFAVPRSSGNAMEDDEDEDGEDGAPSNGDRTNAALGERSSASLASSLPLPSDVGSGYTKVIASPAPSQGGDQGGEKLWCEFAGLEDCRATFPLTDEVGWIQHHARHMGECYPLRFMCWFCDHVPFVADRPSDAFANFVERMQHVRGHILEDPDLNRDFARPDSHVVAHVYEIGLLDDSAYKKTLGDFDHPHSRFQQFPLQPIRMQEDHDLEREERIRLRERRRGRQR